MKELERLEFQLDMLKLKGIIRSMLPRTLSATLDRAIKTFPSVILTGPRQSGKTTLLKKEFKSTHEYISLENPDTRLRVKNDPLGFVARIKKPVIVDEIQYVPELFSYIKSSIDENRLPGKWILTGSQNFSLMSNVSESLAGRAAILSLLPFSIAERQGLGTRSKTAASVINSSLEKTDTNKYDLAEILLRGNYPEIASNPKVNRPLWCGSYINTYLERDIRNLKQVGDLGQYEIFLRACAARTGQVLDLSSIAREIGVSFTTAKRWLSLLETGYQIFLLYPYYKNIGKRLVKRPKLYFTDTGLVSYLLGITTPEILMSSSLLGPLFETLVVIDFWKRFMHHGQIPSIYYLRTQDKLEVDLIVELEDKLNLIEIKSSSTIKPEHAISINKAKQDLGKKAGKAIIISNSHEGFELLNGVTNIPASQILTN